MTAQPAALVTYGWCRVSYVILHALAEKGIEVHVVDASRLAMCRFSRSSSSFQRTQSPWRDQRGYVDDITAIIKRRGVGVLMPGHDDLGAFVEHEGRLPAGCKVALPPVAGLAIAKSKEKTAESAVRCGASAPLTRRPITESGLHALAKTLDYPVVLKPDIGNSAKGVFIVDDAPMLLTRHAEVVAAYGLAPERWPLIQDFVDGRRVGVCALYRHGEPRAVFCEEYLRVKDGRHGTSVMRESIYAPELAAAATSILTALNWHGVAHLDFHWPEGGRPSLLEINPRFWGALDLSVRSGVNMPWLLYRMLVDGDVEPVSDYRLGVRSRWAVGELIYLAHHAARRELRTGVRAVRSVRADGWDDYRRGDLLPLLAEAAYYGQSAIRSGLNPAEEGMIG